MFSKKNKPQRMILEVKEIMRKEPDFARLQPLIPATVPEIVPVPYHEYIDLLCDQARLIEITKIVRSDISQYSIPEILNAILGKAPDKAEETATEENEDA